MTGGRSDGGVGDATLRTSGELSRVEIGDAPPFPSRLLVLGAVEPSAELSFLPVVGYPCPTFFVDVALNQDDIAAAEGAAVARGVK